MGGHPRWVEDSPGNDGEIKSKGQNHFYCWREAQKENGYEQLVKYELHSLFQNSMVHSLNPSPMLNGSHNLENQFLTLGCIKSQGLPAIIIGMHLSFLSVKLSIVYILFQSLEGLWTWATDNVLELCKKFYVNCYFHHLDFLLFCYLLS